MNAISVCAEPQHIAASQVVVVMDISESMKQNDAEKLAPDSLKQLITSLPSYFKIGLVTYHSEVEDYVKLTHAGSKSLFAPLNKITYGGYTNTGIALQQAMDLFTEDSSNRSIVLLTDGEIAMPTKQETKVATQQFEQGVKQLKEENIKVHTIALGNSFYENKKDVLKVSKRTGGSLYDVSSAKQLHRTISRLVFDDLGVVSHTVGVAEMNGAAGDLVVGLPIIGIDRATVLLQGESAIENVVVSGGGSRVSIDKGKRFSVIQIKNPTQKEIQVAFTSSGSIQAELMMESTLSLEIETRYTDTKRTALTSEKKSEIEVLYTDRMADSSLSLLNQRGENILLEDFFVLKTLPVSVDGVVTPIKISDGSLPIEQAVKQSKSQQIQVDLSSLLINMPAQIVSGNLVLEAPTPPVRQERPRSIDPMILIVTAVTLGLLLLSLFYFFYFRKKEKKPIPTPHFESKFEFMGKLNIYVTDTHDDTDIPPHTFDLFRLGKKREISLQNILEKCRLSHVFSGVDQIYFVAGKQGVLQVVNDSDCTILIGRDILVKKRSHTLSYGEKLHITCVDELFEIELHYRNVKPSEKTVLPNPSIRYAE